jgi:hypothetical protein
MMVSSTRSLQGDWYQEPHEEGMLRVWCIVNPPSQPYYHRIDAWDEAVGLINEEADRQLDDPAVTCNAFGLEVYEDGEWHEWEDPCGDQIDHFFDPE